MRERAIGAVLAVVACLIAAAGAHGQAPGPLAGPPGSSHAKVLVIGVDGARWDLVRRAMAEGRAPNLARLAREGVAGPTLLPYTPPAALTISEVGWSTIAAGVGPAKHGVNGFMLNNDPGQATKNGYADFLTRAESLRPSTSTFLASNWANIGLPKHGGPIFGNAIDARYALAAEDTVDSYNRGDAEVTQQSARHLRRGDPDAGFVYLGAVDETAHLIGSATPAYRDAIGAADKRIGALTEAIRQRPTYGLERWTVIVTTDHGQQDLNYPSTLSHGGPSELERTSFVFAAGPGIAGGATTAPGVVDIAPTVLHQLGLAANPAWNLDGRSLVTGATPPARPGARARLRLRGGKPTLELAVDAAPGAPAVASARLALPRGLALRRGTRLRVRGGSVKMARKAIRVTLTRGGSRRALVKTPRGRLAISRTLLRRLRRDPKLALAATVAETGDEALGRRIAVRVRR